LYYDAEQKNFNAKRFLVDTQTLNTKFLFIKEGEGNMLLVATTQAKPLVLIKVGKKKSSAISQKIDLAKVTEIKSRVAVGTKVASDIISAELVNEDEEAKSGELF
jgi:topoisomerase-4 subunit A